MKTYYKPGLTFKTAFIATFFLCITLTAIAIGLHSFRQYQQTIDHITGQELQVLLTATKLSQQSDAIISSSSTLLLAQDQAERRRALYEIAERGEWMDKLIRQLQSLNASPGLYTEVIQAKEHLVNNLAMLDNLIQKRIALQQGSHPSMLKAPDTVTELARINRDLAEVIQKNKLYSTELSISIGYHVVKTKDSILGDAAILRELTHERRYLLIGAFFMSCASVALIAIYVHLFIVRRIVRLQHAVNDNTLLPPNIDTGADEIGRLAATIKQYVKKISEHEAHILNMNKELQFLATYDSLTNIYNRNHFDKITAAMNDAADVSFCVSLVDIDHFKSVNDNFGHRIGDLALAHIAATIKSGLRASDIVARYGGEEFVILMLNTEQHIAYNVLERIRHTIEVTPLQSDKGFVHLTASFGFSQRTEDRQSLDECLRNADLALYAAKRKGRNAVVAHAPELCASKEV